jgi:hypothetical protein
MYRGYEILSEGAFRITRNSNLYLQEEESRSVLESVRTELHNRRKGDAVRLEIESDASAEIVSRLQTVFELQDWQVYRTPAFVQRGEPSGPEVQGFSAARVVAAEGNSRHLGGAAAARRVAASSV